MELKGFDPTIDPLATGVDEMRVEFTKPHRQIVGHVALGGVIAEQDTPFPYIVIELSVAGRSDRTEITLDSVDLSTSVRRARDSKVHAIREIVSRYPERDG